MTKTRSQTAAAIKNGKEDHLLKQGLGSKRINKGRLSAPSSNSRSKGRGAKAKKVEKVDKEIVYSDIVNLGLIKKFDLSLVADQTGNSIGDCHLPRATLNQIIKESLPSDVRAQKETMDLICFIANAFVDLLSDTSNNVCYSQHKKNIIPEHLIRALQELSLDHYIPFLLCEDQNLTLAEIIKSEKKKPNGMTLTAKNFLTCDNKEMREKVVDQVLKRFQDQSMGQERRKKKKNSSKLWMQGLTEKEIEEKQRQLFSMAECDDSEDPFENPASNTQDSPFQGQNDDQINQNGEQQYDEAANQQYWEDYKQNWLQHNQGLLSETYENWVNQHIQYNQQVRQQMESDAANADQANIEQYIVDVNLFKQTYTAESFFEQQYDEYIQQMYGQPQQDNQGEHHNLATDHQNGEQGQTIPAENGQIQQEPHSSHQIEQPVNGNECHEENISQPPVADQTPVPVQEAIAETKMVTPDKNGQIQQLGQQVITKSSTKTDGKSEPQLAELEEGNAEKKVESNEVGDLDFDDME